MSLGGSLWLVPDPDSMVTDQLYKAINTLSQDKTWGTNISRAFSPHMTITSGISDYFLSPAKAVKFRGYGFIHLDEVKLELPSLKVKEVVFGDLFYKRIFLRLERTESLLNLVRTLRSQFVGENQDDLDDFMLRFDPHISLAYADGFTNTDIGSAKYVEIKKDLENMVGTLDLSEAFQFMVLMDTRSKPTTSKAEAVSEWKACPIRLAL